MFTMSDQWIEFLVVWVAVWLPVDFVLMSVLLVRMIKIKAARELPM